MTYRDDESSHAPDSQHALVGGPHHSSDALVAQSNGASRNDPDRQPCPASPRRTSSAAAWMPIRFCTRCAAVGCWHCAWELVMAASIRHCPVVLVPRILLGNGLVPSFQRTAKPGIRSEPRQYSKSSKSLQKTQLALLKSYFVLQAAVRDPVDRQLEHLCRRARPRGIGCRIIWSLNFLNQSEILSISLSGDDPSSDQKQWSMQLPRPITNEVLYKNQPRAFGHPRCTREEATVN